MPCRFEAQSFVDEINSNREKLTSGNLIVPAFGDILRKKHVPITGLEIYQWT
jgi:hypothetical protein